MTNTTNDTIRVPTSNGPDALIEREVFEALDPAHRRSLFWNHSGRGTALVYVNRGRTECGVQAHPHAWRRPGSARGRTHWQCTPLARIIAGATVGERVFYRNGNRADLRRENLRLT